MHRLVAPSHPLGLIGGLAGVTLFVCGAWAGETIRPVGADRCAAFGPGFAAVAGSDTCVRIGGRVRVEAGRGTFDPNTGWANDGVGSADVPGARHHLRLTETGASADPFAR